jgi:hypothetical protein
MMQLWRNINVLHSFVNLLFFRCCCRYIVVLSLSVPVTGDDGGANDMFSSSPLHAEFYITSIRGKEEFAQANIDHVRQPFLRFGRPNLPDVFARVTQLCAKEGIDRVGVVACGPKEMMNDVAQLCSRFHSGDTCHGGSTSTGNTQSGGIGISFDLHLEEFDL